jgi:rfaE bifunctional protein kinase chain/domain
LLIKAVQELAGRKIGVVGDLVADVYISGESDHISREAPILVVNYEEEWVRPGGAACVAVNIAALGSGAIVAGLIADDKMGQTLLREMTREDMEGRVNCDRVIVAPNRGTVTKTRFLAGARLTSRQQVFRLDRGPMFPPEPQMLAEVLEAARAIDDEVEAWVACDYGHGALDDAMREFMRDAATRKPVVVDSWKDAHRFEGMAFIKMNERGAQQAARELGIRFSHGDELAHALQDYLKVRGLLVTLGNEGMLLAVEGAVTRIPAVRADDIVDLTGAGEAVTATLVTALAGGANPITAAWLADHAGSIVVMREGPATATREELMDSIEQDTNHHGPDHHGS